jgi:hypothetical protein
VSFLKQKRFAAKINFECERNLRTKLDNVILAIEQSSKTEVKSDSLSYDLILAINALAR